MTTTALKAAFERAGVTAVVGHVERTVRRIHCCGCGGDVDARLADGGEIYPHRPDLRSLPFWRCDACGNFVGCHHKTRDRTRPLGCIPTPELKEARKRLHALIDPIWQSGKMGRRELYAAIGRDIGREYHTAETRTLEEAREAYRAARKYAQRKAKRTQRPAGEATMNTTTQPGPLEVRLSDQLGAGAGAKGTFACPICGVGEPHGHPDDVIAAYRYDQVRNDGWTSTIKALPKHSGWYLCREVTIPRKQNQDASVLNPQLSWFLWVRDGAARDIETAVPEVLHYEALDQRWSLRNLLGNATMSGAESRYRVYASPRYWREVPEIGMPEDA